MKRSLQLAAMAFLAVGGAASAQSYSVYPSGYSGDGYVPVVISVGRPSKPTLSGTYSNGVYTPSPYTPPDFAQNFSNRIRVVDSDGNFRNRYYGPDTVPGGQQDGRWIGSNWYGPAPVYDTAYNDGMNDIRRQRVWGYGQGIPYRQPQQQYTPSYSTNYRSASQPARQTTSAPRRSSSGTSFATRQAQFNAIMANSNAQIQGIYRNSEIRRGGGSGGGSYGGGGSGGGGGYSYDDNAPRR